MGLFIVSQYYLSAVSPERGFGCESLAADVAVEWAVLQSLQLGLVIPKVLLQIRQLDEGTPAVWDVAFVRALTCNRTEKMNHPQLVSYVN